MYPGDHPEQSPHMTITDVLNLAKVDTITDLLRKIAIGFILRTQLTQVLRRKDPAATSYNLATVEAVGVVPRAPAAVVNRATSIVGTVTGELTPVAFGVTPATGQIGVAPNGDVVVLAADAITSLDVVYTPERGEVFEVTLPVATHVLTLPSVVTTRGVVLLLEAEALVGTVTGKKIVLVPAASAPATGQAKLNIAKTTVTFATADAVTSARVKVWICASSSNDLDTILESTSAIL